MKKKQNFSLNLDTETIELIDKAARKNETTRSAVARMMLELIHYLPNEKFRSVSPLPFLLGLNKEANHAD